MKEFNVYDFIDPSPIKLTPLEELSEEERLYYTAKWVITTTCPECKKEWSREEYVHCTIVGMGLALCEDCSFGENIALVGNNKVWVND